MSHTDKETKTAKTEREVEEDKRIKEVAKQIKQIDRISSHMNLCQAIVKPDCSKPKVQKAQGIQKAIVHILIQSYATNTGDTVLDEESGKVQLENEETVVLGSNTIPSILAKSAKYATLEFAGVKCSSFSETGKDYLRHIGKGIIGKIKYQLPLLRNIVICEEKYKFTPDDFKATTRS